MDFTLMKYANGKTADWFQIGLSTNKTGISIYILCVSKDKTYLAQTYGTKIGKASVTGYCIKFKSLKDINIDILEAAIRYGFEQKNFSFSSSFEQLNLVDTFVQVGCSALRLRIKRSSLNVV